MAWSLPDPVMAEGGRDYLGPGAGPCGRTVPSLWKQMTFEREERRHGQVESRTHTPPEDSPPVPAMTAAGQLKPGLLPFCGFFWGQADELNKNTEASDTPSALGLHGGRIAAIFSALLPCFLFSLLAGVGCVGVRGVFTHLPAPGYLPSHRPRNQWGILLALECLSQ
jgi:hypothetical protein